MTRAPASPVAIPRTPARPGRRRTAAAETASVSTGESVYITAAKPAPSRGMAAKTIRFGATNEIAAETR